ncbi:MAG TPA: condensation domain-containing protein, partial [Verrucomicrobiae bacterium]
MIARETSQAATSSTNRQDILQRRIQERLQAEPEQPTIPRRENAGVAPLSFAQQRLWFLDQLAPGLPVYNIAEALRLQGPLAVEALERSFTEIVRRHEALRTRFESVDGQPMQVIGTPAKFQLTQVDLRHLRGDEQKAELDRLALGEAQAPFDLARDLMLRASLLRIADHDYILLITMHHIASDAWSLGILYREMATLYDAFGNGKTAAEAAALLPELPVQYPDYSVWQRNWLQGEVLQEQLGYWKKQLAGAPEMLELPTDKPRPPVQTFKGAIKSTMFPADLSAKLKVFSRKEGVTLFMTLLAGFKALLLRYSRQTDILVGSPIAGRSLWETENLIGFFINTIVLRSDLSGNPTFRELLQRIRKVTLDGYSHQDLPLEKLVME